MLSASRLPLGWQAAIPLLQSILGRSMKGVAGLHVAASALAGAAPAPARGARAAATPLPPAGTPRHQQQPPQPVPWVHRNRLIVTAATAGTASVAALPEVCPVSAAAFASALDASSGLPDTWLTYWQQREARRQARRALIDATRGRQQQRLRQVATLVYGSSDGGGQAPALAVEQALLSSVLPASQLVRGGSSSGSGSGAGRQPSSASLDVSASLDASLDATLDLPPLQQMSELDELTWLASHPSEGEAAAHAAAAAVHHRHYQHQQHAGAGAGAGMHLWAHPEEQEQQLRWAQQAQQRVAADLAGGAAAAAGAASPAALQGPVQLRVGSEVLSVRPLWIAVHQPEAGGPAKLVETVSPLLPDVVGRLSADLAPFCSVTGLRFGPGEAAGGAWRNFFVGVVGSVAADEDDILWPNQVLHRDRVLFNVRNGWDVARFLAEPRREDVEEHRCNLLRLAEERGYRRGWCWHMLRLRWGEAALRALGVSQP